MGSNFVGAKSELGDLLAFVNSAAHIDGIKEILAPKGITFHTNPQHRLTMEDFGKQQLSALSSISVESWELETSPRRNLPRFFAK